MASQIEWKGSPSWWNYSGKLFLTVVLEALAVASFFAAFEYHGMLALISGAAGVWLFLWTCWEKFSNQFSITNGAISATYGLLSQETHEIEVEDIRDIVIKQSLGGRMVNYGTLEFSSAGRDTAEVIFEGIPDPKSVKQIVTDLRRTTKSSKD